jgi:hypothetical protein
VLQQPADRKIGELPRRNSSNAVLFQKPRPLSNGGGIRPEPTQTCPTERRLFSVNSHIQPRHDRWAVKVQVLQAEFVINEGSADPELLEVIIGVAAQR